MRKINVPEHKKKNADVIAADKEDERVIAHWIECKVKWMQLHPKKELNWETNDKIDMHKQSWGINMKILLNHLNQESGEECQFGCLSEMCCNYPCQLGALTSESFSEIIISTANLLVDTHQLHLNDDMIDKLNFLCVNKRFMEIVRSKKFFSSIMFGSIESDQSAKF